MQRWNELMKKAEATHALVTHGELIQAGASPGQIGWLRRSGRLERVHHGVYRVAGAPPTFATLAAAAVEACGDLSWASHHTAAKLWGLRADRADQRIEVVRPYGTSGSRAGIQVHRSTCLPMHHVTRTQGVPATTVARTIVDLAATIDGPRLDRLISRAVHTDGIPCTIGQVRSVVHEIGGPGRPGTRRMQVALERWNEDEPDTESELDVIGRALLRDLPGVRWQVEMHDEQGYIRRVDGLVPHARLVIEFDGRFHEAPEQRRLDLANDERLGRLGYVVRRWRWRDIAERAAVTRDEARRLANATAA